MHDAYLICNSLTLKQLRNSNWQKKGSDKMSYDFLDKIQEISQKVIE